MGGNNDFFENFERNKYLKKLPSMQRVKCITMSKGLMVALVTMTIVVHLPSFDLRLWLGLLVSERPSVTATKLTVHQNLQQMAHTLKHNPKRNAKNCTENIARKQMDNLLKVLSKTNVSKHSSI